MESFSTGEVYGGFSVASMTCDGSTKHFIMEGDTVSLLPVLVNENDPMESLIFIDEVESVVDFSTHKDLMYQTLKGKMITRDCYSYSEADELAHGLARKESLNGITDLICITPANIENNSSNTWLFYMKVQEGYEDTTLKSKTVRSMVSEILGSKYNNPVDSSLATTVTLLSHILCWGKS